MTYQPLEYDMREATVEEIVECYGIYEKVSFRHFVVEMSRRNAKNGVAHKEYARSTLRVFNGKVFVLHHGRLQEVTAQFGIIENTGMSKPRLFDLRIKSEYLPTTFK